MPNFNSPKDAEKYKNKVYADRAADDSAKAAAALAESRAQAAEERAEKAYRQNRVLLIFTITLGFLELFVAIFSNLDRIISNIVLLFCK